MQCHTRLICSSNFVSEGWGRPFPISALQCRCAQSEVHTEMVCRDRCGRTWLACTEPWPQTQSKTFGMIWNVDCKPGLIAQHQWPTSLMLVAECKQVPSAMFLHLVESLPRRVEAVIAAKGYQLYINAYDFGMRCSMSRCPHTFWSCGVLYNTA